MKSPKVYNNQQYKSIYKLTENSLAYNLHTNKMEKKINNILKAYGADSSIDKREVITKLLEQIDNDGPDSNKNLMEIIKSFVENNKSQDVDLDKIRKIIKEID